MAGAAGPRIVPLEPPFEPAVDEQLRSMMPAGAPPIALFRTFVRNLPMAEAMHPWGRHELSRSLSVGLREREIVIDRTCARCGCEYEWGVHVAFFAGRSGARRCPGDLPDPRRSPMTAAGTCSASVC